MLQEYSPARAEAGRRATQLIFKGTALGFTEAPHLYKRDGYYYLLTAEGGTGWGHAVTMARSRDAARAVRAAPGHVHPDRAPSAGRRLQRAGHADLVETQDGETYMVYLCGRPLAESRPLHARARDGDPDRWSGARTAGCARPTARACRASRSPAPGLPDASVSGATPTREEFDGPELPIDFQWLRSPWPDELFSLAERPGFLRLYGRETIGSLFRQALVARRQQAHCYSASTLMEFEPEHFQQMAGLVCYYNASKFHYLYVSHDDAIGKHIRVMSCLPDQLAADAFTAPIPIPTGPVELRVEVDYERLHFAYRVGGGEWAWLPEQFDASILSDEAAAPGPPNFTGAFVGVCCQDLAGTGRPADFDWFEYRERGYLADPFADSVTV